MTNQIRVFTGKAECIVLDSALKEYHHTKDIAKSVYFVQLMKQY